MFTTDEMDDLIEAAAEGGMTPIDTDVIRAIATKTAKLLAARGGSDETEAKMLDAASLEEVLQLLEDGGRPDRVDAEALLARVAELEAQVKSDAAAARANIEGWRDTAKAREASIHRLEQVIAALKRVAAERRISDAGLEQLLAPVDAYVREKVQGHLAALGQHIAELEKSLENARRERDDHLRAAREWENRYKAAAQERDDAEGLNASLERKLEIRKAWNSAAEACLVKLAEVVHLGHPDPIQTFPTDGPEFAHLIDAVRFNVEGLKAAVADNATLLQELRIWIEGGWDFEHFQRCKAMLRDATPHPGAAMLEVANLLRQYQRKDEAVGMEPSGQVAEDVEHLRETLEANAVHATSAPKLRAGGPHGALSRLATMAQGYDREHALRMTRQADADAANAAKAVAVSERDAAVADNAALLETLRRARAVIDDTSATPGFRMGAGMGIEMTINLPHPGAALLERMKRLEEYVTQQAAVACEEETVATKSCGDCATCNARALLAGH